MIKTFINNDLALLDQNVNDFMATMNRDCPVRTESYVCADGVMHKATVFFDSPHVGAPTEKVVDDKPTSSAGRIGALWDNGAVIKGNLVIGADKKWVNFTKQEWDVLKREKDERTGFEVIKTLLHGVNVVIKVNPKRDTEKHPNWIIYPRG